MTNPTEQEQVHLARGIALTVLLGPILLVGVLLVATAVISMFISGWMPSRWFSDSAADWLVGGGVQGDAANYVRFMIGAMLTGGSWYGITWGFHGGGDQA